MKRNFILYLLALLPLIGTAQGVADKINQIRLDTCFLYSEAIAETDDAARLQSLRKLLSSINAYNGAPVPTSQLKSLISSLKQKTANGQAYAFTYVRKNSWKQASQETRRDSVPPAKKPEAVTFRFSDGIHNQALKAKVEQNITQLLTAINKTYPDSLIDCSSLPLTPAARTGLENMWKHIRFFCEKEQNLRPCLKDVNEYNVRDIPITIRESAQYKGERRRDLSINFNEAGQITGVRFAAEKTTYDKIMRSSGGQAVTDEARRRTILGFVENYRNYYIEMNLDAIKQIFDDNALIITGRVIKVANKNKGDNNKMSISKQTTYRKQNKAEYMQSLQTLFKNTACIQLEFDYDGVSVVQDKSKPYIYGVTLKQYWNSKNKAGKHYSDEGYLFLVWDFSDEENPKIHVRTWQPLESVSDESQIMNLNSIRY